MSEPLQADPGTGALQKLQADRIMDNIDWALRNLPPMSSALNPIRSISIWVENKRRMRESWVLMISNARLQLQDEMDR